MENHLHLDESSRAPAQTWDQDTQESATSPHPHPAFDPFAQTCAIFPMEYDDFPDDSSDWDDESSGVLSTTPASGSGGNESWGYLSDDHSWDTDVVDHPNPDPHHIREQPQGDSELECHEDECPKSDNPIKATMTPGLMMTWPLQFPPALRAGPDFFSTRIHAPICRPPNRKCR